VVPVKVMEIHPVRRGPAASEHKAEPNLEIPTAPAHNPRQVLLVRERAAEAWEELPAEERQAEAAEE